MSTELNFRLYKSLSLDSHEFYHERVVKEDQHMAATLTKDSGILDITIFEDKAMRTIARLTAALETSMDREREARATIEKLSLKLKNGVQ